MSAKNLISLACGIIAVLLGLFLLHRIGHKNTPAIPTPTASNPVVSATPVVQPVQKPVAAPVEPPLPVGTNRFVVALSDKNSDVEANLVSGGYISDAASFDALLGTTQLAARRL